MIDPVITFLSDYGLQDAFVGICHAVITGICPQARIIDLTHGIARHDVREGALILADALRFLPVGVHLAVVDPDVGAERRAVALTLADGRTLVGPDNGLLWPAAQAGGGAVEAVEVSHSPLRLEPVSATFHGRDIFAPVAAHLAAGVALGDAGRPLAVTGLVTLELPRAELRDGVLVAPVAHVDRFGNVQLAVTHDDLEQFGLRLGRQVELRLTSNEPHSARYVRTFADARSGELIVYEDSSRRLAVAFAHANAAERLGLRAGDELRLAPAG
jgi:S-adenosylmethionine hydrolase